MAKKKNSMALFEVISKSRDKNPDSEVTVPGWIKPGQQAQQDQAPAPREPVSPEPLEPETQTPAPRDEVAATETVAAAPTLPTTSTWEPRRPAETPGKSDLPIWSTAGGRLTLSLNYVSCLVVSMGILLLIIGAFALGRMTAPDPASLGRSGQSVEERQFGKFYMVIQTLDGNTVPMMAEAKRIVKFCAENDEPSEIKQVGKNLIVWSLTPFNKKNSEEVTAHALFIQNDLGMKYARKYGSKYKFIQPKKNGELAPVMYEHEKPVQKKSGQ